MKFYLILLGIFLVFSLFPFLRFFIKRLICAVKIKKACRDNDFIFKPTHFLWFMGLNNSGHCDFYCISQKDSRKYSVKLFGALYRRQILDFIEGNRYRWMRYKFMMVGRGMVVPNSLGDAIAHVKMGRIKNYRKVDYFYVDKDDYMHRMIPVLLLCPVPMKIRQSKEVILRQSIQDRPKMFEKKPDKTIIGNDVYDGHLLYDEYVFSTPGFVSELYISCII